jgi:hypothetical protein
MYFIIEKGPRNNSTNQLLVLNFNKFWLKIQFSRAGQKIPFPQKIIPATNSSFRPLKKVYLFTFFGKKIWILSNAHRFSFFPFKHSSSF